MVNTESKGIYIPNWVPRGIPRPAGFPDIAFKLSGKATETPLHTSCEFKIEDENNINRETAKLRIVYPLYFVRDLMNHVNLQLLMAKDKRNIYEDC